MKLFSEKVEYTSISSPFNIIQVEDCNEIFFGVYEIEINKIKYPVEKISEHNGAPVVSVPVSIDGIEKEYPFILTKGKFEVFFNESIDSSGLSNIKTVDDTDEKIHLEDIIDIDSIEEESFNANYEDLISEKIQQARVTADQIIKNAEAKRKRILHRENINKQKELEATLAIARDSLVDEFVKFSNSIKEDIVSESSNNIHQQVLDIKNVLEGSLREDFNGATKEFHKSIETLAKEYFSQINITIGNKIKDTEDLIDNKIVETKNIINKTFEVISSENIKLSDNINKGVNKALSRVGNNTIKINEVSAELTNKIKEEIEHVKNIISEEFSLIKENTLSITDKENFKALIEETQNNLTEQINTVKNNIIISEKKQPGKDFKKIEEKINQTLQAEIINLKKYVASYSGGGGSVATQYANGGIMNGDLTVNGSINSQSFNISSNQFSDYSLQAIFKDSLLQGNNLTETFPIRISPSLSTAKLFISYISSTKKTAVEAFAMYMDTSCFINVYSVIHSDTSNPLLLDIQCNNSNDVLNILSNVSEDCLVVINGIATYIDDSTGLLFNL
jgi:hypothetical protein